MFVYKIYVENDIIVKTEVSGVGDEPMAPEYYRDAYDSDDYSDLAYYEAMANQMIEDGLLGDVDLLY